MSTAVTFTAPFMPQFAVPVGVSVGVALGVSVPLLALALNELKLAVRDLRELRCADGCVVKVDGVVETGTGERIGVRLQTGKPVELVLADPKSDAARACVDKVKQAYARLKVLDEVKKKGYKKVKEEVLPDGSIRVVVQRWQ
ncbi:MAG: DUF1257 domain-containing protein [Deltaproteobacteria bacterium]|nr:DUF1257 domain-containing protein [Deltaproteobacteria bacterium]